MRRYINDYCERIGSSEVAYGARAIKNESRPCCCSRCGKEISEFATEQNFVDFGERLCDQCYTDELAMLGLLTFSSKKPPTSKVGDELRSHKLLTK